MQKDLKWLAGVPIRLYHVLISPLKAPTCRFHPTCSAYALESIEKHGALKGVLLAAIRIARCHPWSRKNFHDPVPEAFAWRDLIRYKRGTSQNH